MPLNNLTTRTTTPILLFLLLLEVALVLSLRRLGWVGTGNAIQFVTCIFVTLVPLVVASAPYEVFRWKTTSNARFLRTIGSAFRHFNLSASVAAFPMMDCDCSKACFLVSSTLIVFLQMMSWPRQIGTVPCRISVCYAFGAKSHRGVNHFHVNTSTISHHFPTLRCSWCSATLSTIPTRVNWLRRIQSNASYSAIRRSHRRVNRICQMAQLIGSSIEIERPWHQHGMNAAPAKSRFQNGRHRIGLANHLIHHPRKVDGVSLRPVIGVK